MNMKSWFWMIPVVIFLLGFTAICGIFNSSTYMQETLSLAAQGIGQDMLDLFIVVPFFIITGYYLWKGSKVALFVAFGILFYVAYSYVVYSFAMYFSWLFLFYVATLGFSIYALIFGLKGLNAEAVKNAFSEKAPIKETGILLYIVGAIFGILWLKDIIGSYFSGIIPQSILEAGLPSNPVYIIDLAFLIPAFLLIARMATKKEASSYVYAIPLLVFNLIMSLNIIVMNISLYVKGFSEGLISLIPVLSVMSLIVLACLILLVNFISSFNNSTQS